MRLRPGEWENHAIVVLETDSFDSYPGAVQYREPDFDGRITGIATTEKKGTERLRLLRV